MISEGAETAGGEMEDERALLAADKDTNPEKDELMRLALRVIRHDIDAAERASRAEEPKRTEQYNLYRARETARKFDDETSSPLKKRRSSIVSSDVMNCIEWIMPDLMRAFAGNRRAISVVPRSGEDAGKAEKVEKLLNWQFMNECQGFLTLQSWIKTALIYGIGHVKTSWEDRYEYKGFSIPEVIEPDFRQMMDDENVDYLEYGESKEIPVPAGLSGNAAVTGAQPGALETMRVYKDVRGERKLKIYSGPKLEVVPPEDFLIDPEADDIDSARFTIHKVTRTLSYLRKKEREGIYSNIDAVIARTSSGSGSDRQQDSAEEIQRQITAGAYTALYGGEDEASQVGRRRVDVYEWWGELDVNGDGRTEPYLAAVCRDVIIRLVRNPYAHGRSPFVDLRPIVDVFEYSGIGFAEIAGPFQKIKTNVIRQILDNVSFVNNQMWEVDENAGVDVDALANPYPGKVVFTNRLGGIRPITPAPLDSMAYNLMEFMQGQLEQVTGVTRYNQGLDANTLNKTATGISAIMSASNQRKELIARTIAETGLRKLFMKMLQLDQQFVDQNIVVRLFNEPLEISPDDLAGNFDVIVDVGNAVTDDRTQVTRLAQILQFAPMLMQAGAMCPRNVYEVCRKILSLWGYTQPELFLSDPEDARQIQETMRILSQMAQSVQAGIEIRPDVVTQALQMAIVTLAGISGQAPSAALAQPPVRREEAPYGDGAAQSEQKI